MEERVRPLRTCVRRLSILAAAALAADEVALNELLKPPIGAGRCALLSGSVRQQLLNVLGMLNALTHAHLDSLLSTEVLELVLGGCAQLDDQSISLVLISGRGVNLCSLFLDALSITDAAIRQLPVSCPHLARLSLRRCRRLTEPAVQARAHFSPSNSTTPPFFINYKVNL